MMWFIDFIIEPTRLTTVGLFFDIVGVIILSYGLMIDKKTAVRLGVSRFSSKKFEENLALPQVQDRLRQSRNAKWGLGFIVLGVVLQIVANTLG